MKNMNRMIIWLFSNVEHVLQQEYERFVRALTRVDVRPYFDLSYYDGKLDSLEFLDWITKIGNYFEYEYF